MEAEEAPEQEDRRTTRWAAIPGSPWSWIIGILAYLGADALWGQDLDGRAAHAFDVGLPLLVLASTYDPELSQIGSARFTRVLRVSLLVIAAFRVVLVIVNPT